MKQLIFAAVVFSFLNPVFAADVTWTNAGGDGDWANPQNWDTGTVPGVNDNVYIPDGSSTCTIDGDATGLIVIALLENRGTIEYTGDTRIIAPTGIDNFGSISGDEGFLLLATDAHIVNSGTLCGGSLECHCESFSNNEESEIAFGGNGIRITAGMDMENRGELYTSNGGDIHIGCGYINNWGYIKAGNGTTDGNPGGGSLYITAYAESELRVGAINHYSGGFMGAGTNVSLEVAAGLVALTATSIFLTGIVDIPPDVTRQPDNPGKSERIERGDIVLYAEGMNIGGETAQLHGATVTFQGRDLTFFGPANYYMVRSVDNMYFATTADGTLDFTDLHDSRAIRSVEEIFINSNTILEPTEGLSEICDPDPIVLEADTTLLASSVYCPAVRDSGGMPGTGEFILQNLGTGTSVFDYTVISTNEWVSLMDASTGPLAPFESTALEFSYLIPGGTTPGTQDTIVIVTSVNETYSDTTYSTILNLAEGLAADPAVFRDVDISLNVSPNPFHSICTISTVHGNDPLSRVEIFDLSGHCIMKTRLDDHSSFEWRPEMSVNNGVYLVKAHSNAGVATQRIVYMR